MTCRPRPTRAADLIEERSRIDALVWDALAEPVGFVGAGGGEAERDRIYEVTIDRHRQNPIGVRRSRVRGALQRRRA